MLISLLILLYNIHIYIKYMFTNTLAGRREVDDRGK